MTKIYPVIMCGGAGTRLWPLSRREKPKQFNTLTGDLSMLQTTVKRVQSGSAHDIAPPSFVCADQDGKKVEEQCRQIGAEFLYIIREPMGRNTAPLAAIISLLINNIDPDGLILLLPADHVIEHTEIFWTYIDKGVPAARDGNLVTLGITPDRPKTGYGYIRHGEKTYENVYQVDAFVEKPDKKTAQSYLDAGNYYWNAGIFMFSPKTMIESFSKHAQETLTASQRTLDKSKTSQKSFVLDAETFATCPADSIDYVIMEKADNVAMVAPVSIGWNDIGSWPEWAEMVSMNARSSNPEKPLQIQIDCTNTFIHSDGPFVAGVGLENLIVVVEDGKVLVMPKDRAQDVKKIVTYLKQSGLDDLC